MKKINFFMLSCFAIIMVLYSCTHPLDKPLNKEDFAKIKEVIKEDKSLSDIKAKFIIDNLSTYLGFMELGKAITEKEVNPKPYREYIEELKIEYDSTKQVILTNTENNKKIKEFITLIDANATSISQYKGYLTMKLKFNNQFDKPVLYSVINYKYIDKYDSKYFDSKVKITDKLAKDFNSEVEVSTKEEYNDIAKFMYKKVPVQAPLKMRNELGTKKANEKLHRDFLMNGLKVETLLVVFEDKSELTIQNEDWEYLN